MFAYYVMDHLKLHNQICFPVYTLAKEIVNRYRPFLQELDLTYPQYLVMLVLWESDRQTVSEIGEKVHLDSGTLTPLLKRLGQKGVVTRCRSDKDERNVIVALTDLGRKLQQKAAAVPEQMAAALSLSEKDLKKLKCNIDQILSNL